LARVPVSNVGASISCNALRRTSADVAAGVIAGASCSPRAAASGGSLAAVLGFGRGLGCGGLSAAGGGGVGIGTGGTAGGFANVAVTPAGAGGSFSATEAGGGGFGPATPTSVFCGVRLGGAASACSPSALPAPAVGTSSSLFPSLTQRDSSTYQRQFSDHVRGLCGSRSESGSLPALVVIPSAP
jgi:hypothetical protein